MPLMTRFFSSIGTRISIFIFLVTLFTALMISFVYHTLTNNIIVQKELDQLAFNAQLLGPRFSESYNIIKNDVFILSKMPPAQGIIRATQNDGIDPLDGSSLEEWKTRFSESFSAVLASHPHYTKIRYIGLEDGGKELLRMDSSGEEIIRTAEQYLQKKDSRPYFIETIKLDQGQFHFSDITLNRENGKVSYPPTPVLRVATPIYDTKNQVFGIIVISVNYKGIMADLKLRAGEIRSLYAINSRGDYLVHPDKEKEFGFDRKERFLVSEDFPELTSEKIVREDDYSFFSENTGQFVYYFKIPFDVSNPDHFLGILLADHRGRILGDAFVIRNISLLLTLLLALFVAIGTILLARLWLKPLNQVIQGVRAYEAGETDISLPTQRRDEIGELASAFVSLQKKLNIAQKAERQSYAELQAIMETTVDGLITIDEIGTIKTFNRACEKIFGYTVEEAVGQNVKILMPEPYHSEHDGYLKNYHDTGIRKISGMGRELVGKRKNGTTFPIDLAVSEVDLGDRKLFSGIVRDITFRKEAEEELMRSNKDLEEFAYIASHDLKAPLRRVSLCADFLEKDYEDKLDDKAKEFLEIMTKSTARMQDMIESLLKYSLIGRDGQDFENVDLNEVVDAAKQSLCVVIEESDSEIKCDELPCVTGSKSLLIQLFQNLIGNAVKYVEKGTKPKVEISVEEKDGQWIFSISDNGVGIEPQYAEQIFQIFRRLHGDDEYTGTGIGLSLCQRIVASHDGKIWLDTSYTGGCRFCFTLSSVC